MALSNDKLALWGGIECTVNRVGDVYFDQIRRAGHKERPSDLQRIADLGIRKLRYPVLWEHICPRGDLATADWSWHDKRLGLLQSLNVDPIAGLLHHGSGPRNTDLLDAGLAAGLQSFAKACAERYPWVQDYTPVNEPLTTARFSALYGFWYPHQRDTNLFFRALVNQCKAIALSMKAVRKVNARARLIQTEDFGTVRSTKHLTYQADLDNQRRWLSLDLLCGHVDKTHPLYELMARSTSEAEVAFFRDSPCPPDVIGVNYYVTSDRFLDHRLSKYPAQLHGGNGRDAYVDVESVRTGVGMRGHAETLRTVWDRYGIPLAITEVHLDCHREEQLRWLSEAWTAANSVRSLGVNVQAVTMWSLLGAYDWNSLCTRPDGYYEPGAFDLRSDPPRPTALAKAAAELCAHGRLEHPTLNERGWWWRPTAKPVASRRASRNACPPMRQTGLSIKPNDESHPGRPILIVGDGAFAMAVQQACDDRSITNTIVSPAHGQASMREAFATVEEGPWAVVYANDDEDLCEQAAAIARERALPFVLISEDVVFEEDQDARCDESVASVLGKRNSDKAIALQKVAIDACPQALLVRTCALFGPGCENGVVGTIATQLLQGESIAVPSDVVATPTYLPDVVRVLLDLLIDGEQGAWHLTNANDLSWADTLASLAEHLGAEPRQINPCTQAQLPQPWQCGSPLASRRAQIMPTLNDAFARYAAATSAEAKQVGKLRVLVRRFLR